jgi:hypothetical protein
VGFNQKVLQASSKKVAQASYIRKFHQEKERKLHRTASFISNDVEFAHAGYVPERRIRFHVIPCP